MLSSAPTHRRLILFFPCVLFSPGMAEDGVAGFPSQLHDSHEEIFHE